MHSLHQHAFITLTCIHYINMHSLHQHAFITLPLTCIHYININMHSLHQHAFITLTCIHYINMHSFIHLCSEQTHSYRFGSTWGWVNDDRIFIFWVNCLFKDLVQSLVNVIFVSMCVQSLRRVQASLQRPLTAPAAFQRTSFYRLTWRIQKGLELIGKAVNAKIAGGSVKTISRYVSSGIMSPICIIQTDSVSYFPSNLKTPWIQFSSCL